MIQTERKKDFQELLLNQPILSPLLSKSILFMGLTINHRLFSQKSRELLKFLIGEILLLQNSINLKMLDLLSRENSAEFNSVHKIIFRLKMLGRELRQNFLTKLEDFTTEMKLEISQLLKLSGTTIIMKLDLLWCLDLLF